MLIFQPLYYALKRLDDTEKVLSRKSDGVSTKTIVTPTTVNNSISPTIKWYGNSNLCLIFKGRWLKQKSNFYSSNYNKCFIVYNQDTLSKDLNAYLTLKDCLFRGVKLAYSADPDKYSYSGCGIGFHSASIFSYIFFEWGKNAIVFGVDNSSSVHNVNKKHYILVLGEGLDEPTQGLGDTTITAEPKYSINFSRLNRL